MITAVDGFVVRIARTPGMRRESTLVGHGMEEDVDAQAVPIG